MIRPGPGPENWISRTNYPSAGIVPAGPAEMSLYVVRRYSLPHSYLGRYSWRTDGFSSVSAPYSGGELVTRPFTFTGRHLKLNFSTSAAGSIQVEVQDAQGEALPGFSLADSLPLAGDEIDHTVAWEDGGTTELTNLAPICRGHHRVKHHGGWTVHQIGGSGGSLEWTSPSGRRYRVDPERRVPVFRVAHADGGAPF